MMRIKRVYVHVEYELDNKQEHIEWDLGGDERKPTQLLNFQVTQTKRHGCAEPKGVFGGPTEYCPTGEGSFALKVETVDTMQAAKFDDFRHAHDKVVFLGPDVGVAPGTLMDDSSFQVALEGAFQKGWNAHVKATAKGQTPSDRDFDQTEAVAVSEIMTLHGRTHTKRVANWSVSASGRHEQRVSETTDHGPARHFDFVEDNRKAHIIEELGKKQALDQSPDTTKEMQNLVTASFRAAETELGVEYVVDGIKVRTLTRELYGKTIRMQNEKAGDDYALFLEMPNKEEDRRIMDDEQVKMVPGLVFYTIPPAKFGKDAFMAQDETISVFGVPNNLVLFVRNIVKTMHTQGIDKAGALKMVNNAVMVAQKKTLDSELMVGLEKLVDAEWTHLNKS